MTVTSQGGIFGFGPQASQGTLATSFYRHKAGGIDLAPVDDVRTGPPEVGGVSVPTIPYKAGTLAAGGAVMYPRLENTFGWLLYGAMGGYTVSGSSGGVGFPEVCMPRKYLRTATQTITTGLTSPTSGSPTKLIVKGYRDGTSSITGNVIITGTTSGSATVESIALSDKNEVQSSYTWATITSIQLPARTNTDGNDAVSVGWYDTGMRSHQFGLDANSSIFLPWMSFRKLIPAGANGQTYGETFLDGKILSAVFTIPNTGLIAARVDAMACSYEMVTNPSASWTWANTYELYESLPIGCRTGGYIAVPSFGDRPLPVVSCQVGIQNAPLPVDQERIVGNPYLDDITIVSRRLSIDVVCKWRDADLYRAIFSGSKTGTEWTTTPFVKSLDVASFSPGFATGGNSPYGLRVESDSVLWTMAGGVQLAGNEMVAIRLQGIALDTNGNYGKISLINRQTSYAWPS